MYLTIDRDLLHQFEEQLDPLCPEAGKITAKVLGYGEISTVFAIGDDDLAYKRMPIFQADGELQAYEHIYDEYNRLLVEDIGIQIPPYGRVSLISEGERPVLYIVQQKLNPDSIGDHAMQMLGREDVLRLVRAVLFELKKVWSFNHTQVGLDVAIDGQISNWSIQGFDPDHPAFDPDIDLLYLDTSTPLYRIDGVEQLDAELFLRSAPSFLAWVLRRFFLDDVVGRYYDFHRVVVDLIANFYKEQRSELVPDLIDLANDFFTTEAAALNVEPITLEEVQAYYREDAFIWRLYQGARRLDRWLHTTLLRKPYPYILPGPVTR